MIEKKTIVEQIEILADGHIQIRFALLLIEDDVVIDRKLHRTSVEPGGDVDAQIAAVNEHLAAMKKEPVPAPETERVKAHAEVAWTKEVVDAHRARKLEHDAQVEK